jgi:release factor glutamine methyltransferase
MLHPFLGVELELGPGVLKPRRETELLGRVAIDLLSRRGMGQTVIDMCCGSGNLAIAIAAAEPTARIFASDLTNETVATARANTARLGLGDRVSISQGDLFSGLTALMLQGQVDLIVSNPPYISSKRLQEESAHLIASEPREAFDAGPYGIAIHQRLIAEAPVYLKPGGWLAFEFGQGQDRLVASLLRRSASLSPPRFIVDDSHAPRVALSQKKD